MEKVLLSRHCLGHLLGQVKGWALGPRGFVPGFHPPSPWRADVQVDQHRHGPERQGERRVWGHKAATHQQRAQEDFLEEVPSVTGLEMSRGQPRREAAATCARAWGAVRVRKQGQWTCLSVILGSKLPEGRCRLFLQSCDNFLVLFNIYV